MAHELAARDEVVEAEIVADVATVWDPAEVVDYLGDHYPPADSGYYIEGVDEVLDREDLSDSDKIRVLRLYSVMRDEAVNEEDE